MLNTAKYLFKNLEKYPNQSAISSKGKSGSWETKTWSEFYDMVQSISKSFISLGINKNDKI